MRRLPALAAILSGTLMAGHAMADVTIYSGQHESGTKAVADAFTEATGIKTVIRKGSSEQFAGQLTEEGEKTPADVFWSEQIPPILALSDRGLLAELDDDIIAATSGEGFEAVPTAPGKDWVATSGRARVVVYDPDKIDEADLADSVLAYATPEWEGRIGFVPTSGAFLEQIITITKMEGEDAARDWLSGLKEHGKQYAKNSVALEAVERGEVPAALINNYYWYNMVRERGGKDEVKSRLHFIGHQDPGALVSYAAIAVLEGSDNKDEAEKFVEFVVSQEGQQVFSDLRAEYPLRADVTSAFEMTPYSELGSPVVEPTTFEDRENAIRLLEEVGLK